MPINNNFFLYICLQIECDSLFCLTTAVSKDRQSISSGFNKIRTSTFQATINKYSQSNKFNSNRAYHFFIIDYEVCSFILKHVNILKESNPARKVEMLP